MRLDSSLLAEEVSCTSAGRPAPHSAGYSTRMLVTADIIPALAQAPASLERWGNLDEWSLALFPGKEGEAPRSEEHTSELQSRVDLVCRLLFEKKNGKRRISERLYQK